MPEWQNEGVSVPALAGIGPRLRAVRSERQMTLDALAERTGISVSTLSRLEAGRRRPNLELLVPLASVYGVTLDELLGPAIPADPRVRPIRQDRDGVTAERLSAHAGGVQVWRMRIHPGRKPNLQVHDGHDWIYVLDGRLRLLLDDREIYLSQGEAAEFDTRIGHWMGAATDQPVDILVLFGPQGERVHLRARAVGATG